MSTTRKRILAVLATIAMIFSIGLASASAASATMKIHKSYVCKYVGQPGVDERLQTGNNPIYVDNHSLTGKWFSDVKVGDTFSDRQGKSVVIVANTPKLDPEPGIDQCPAPQGPSPKVTTSDETVKNCDGVFTVTTTVTTPYVLVPIKHDGKIKDYEWVLDTKNATTVVGAPVFVRALTKEEAKELKCEVDHETKVIPTSPTLTAPTCSVGTTVILAPNTDIVTYKDDGKGTVTATTKRGEGGAVFDKENLPTGWTWVDGHKVTFAYTLLPKLTGAQCETTPPPVVTPGPAIPAASITTTCDTATINLSNLTPLTTDESATFNVMVNGKIYYSSVVLKAGDKQTITYHRSTSGVINLAVAVDGKELAAATMAICPVTVPPAAPAPPAVAPAANVATLPHTGPSLAAYVYGGLGALALLLGFSLIWGTRRKGLIE